MNRTQLKATILSLGFVFISCRHSEIRDADVKAASGSTNFKSCLQAFRQLSKNSNGAGIRQSFDKESIKKLERNSRRFLGKNAKTWVENRNCTSCHTTFPYALSGQIEATNKSLIKYIDKRTKNILAGNPNPFYESYANGSIGSEAVLNASSLILINEAGKTTVKSSKISRSMIVMLDAIKMTDGRANLEWLDGFGLRPFESDTASSWGLSLAALTIGKDPTGIRHLGEHATKIEAIKTRLIGTFENQSLINRLMTVWASKHLDNFLPSAMTENTIAEARALLKSGKSIYKDLPGATSRNVDAFQDDFSTAFPLVVLLESGIADDLVMDSLEKLLIRSSSGSPFQGYSANTGRVSRFMTDNANGYALYAIKLARSKGLIP